MRHAASILLLAVALLPAARHVQAEELGYEVWQAGWVLENGREQNEPLDSTLHMTDSRLAIGLNNSAVVSRSGYAYCTDTNWAFTFKSSESWRYWDFTDASITPDLEFIQRNNTGGAFRILLATAPGDEYVVSENVYNYVGSEASGWWETASIDLSSLNWLSFDPTDSSIGSAITPDFSAIYELGFTYAGSAAASRIDNIRIQGRLVPEPSTLVLLTVCLAMAPVLRRRRRTNPR